jgi:ATP-dependent Zn protease
LIDEELDRLTTLLLERETIDGDSVYRLVGNRVSS